MAWTDSRVFRAYLGDLVQGTVENQGTTSMDWVEATNIKAALYDNDNTPDNDVTAANTAYNVGQWAIAGNELSDGAEWAAGGVNLASRAVSVAVADRVRLTAANTASGTSATLLLVFGCLVYADSITTPVADQGFCYNYFGGTNSVTDGTFTIVWNANGVIEFVL
jgi:hypothetical protein